ncbi:hypothetical protein CASFOL_029394 [Castilleja foliolosa]|uniref:Uncharacterized protein n=1 Tax=Castilleja foliolosa TaxID=1961234 RepID=A0ABD3CDN7_9LAMI
MASNSSETTRRKHHRPSSTDDVDEHSKRRKHRHHHRHHHRRLRSGKDKEGTNPIAEGLEIPKTDEIEVAPGELVNNGVGKLGEVLDSGGLGFSRLDYEMEEEEIVEDDGLEGGEVVDGGELVVGVEGEWRFR